jgi:hypothetical protein
MLMNPALNPLRHMSRASQRATIDMRPMRQAVDSSFIKPCLAYVKTTIGCITESDCAMWTTTISRMPRLEKPKFDGARKQHPVSYPLCNIRGGLCDVLLSSVPLSIVGIQFIRDENDVVQDGLVIFANDHAEQVFCKDADSLVGARFLAACQDMLLAGVWQRCLWVCAHGKGETMIETDRTGETLFLTIAPYGDGLILCRSLKQQS